MTPAPAESEKPSPVNVPPPSGVNTSYWLPSPSVKIVGISPSGFCAEGGGGEDRTTLTVIVAEHASSRSTPSAGWHSPAA